MSMMHHPSPNQIPKKALLGAMDFHQLVQHSIANINDELSKILTLATLFDSKPSDAQSAFHKKIVQEFNSKIHKIKSENARLGQKNKALTEKVKLLESQLRNHQTRSGALPIKARATKSDGALRIEAIRAPAGFSEQSRAAPLEKPGADILSSPIKGVESVPAPARTLSEAHGLEVKHELTSSQFNRLATQYSDASSQPEMPPMKMPRLCVESSSLLKRKGSDFAEAGARAQLHSSSPFKRHRLRSGRNTELAFQGAFASDDESAEGAGNEAVGRVVSDSQDEFEPLGNVGWSPVKQNRGPGAEACAGSMAPRYPSHYTSLQRVEFLRNYLWSKVGDAKFTVDFSRNPITEKPWVPEDFARNEKWKPPKKINANLGVMTKAREKTYSEFFEKAGLGRPSAGPAWDSDEEPGRALDNGEWVRSQVMDKYLSPPGFMVGDFATTQEVEERRKIRAHKDHERIQRRLKSAVAGGEFLFYEAVFNEFVRAGKYVNGP